MKLRQFTERVLLVLVACYLRNTSKQLGRYKLVHGFTPLLRKWGNKLGKRVIWTRHNFKMTLYLNDRINQYVWFTGDYESPTAQLFYKLLNDGSCVVDIGANAGFYSLLSSKLCGNSGHVYSFEPNPVMYQRLQENIDINKLTNIDSQQIAISDKQGHATLYLGPEDHSGVTSMRSLENANELRVRTDTLDNILAGNISIDLIKIDIEGAEQSALGGMLATLRKYEPYLILEVSDKYLQSFGHTANTLFDMLQDLGYLMFCIEDNQLVYLANKLDEWPFQFNALLSTKNKLPDEFKSLI